METEEEALKGGGSMVSLARVLRGDLKSQNHPEGEGEVYSGSVTAQGKALLQGAAFLNEPIECRWKQTRIFHPRPLGVPFARMNTFVRGRCV